MILFRLFLHVQVIKMAHQAGIAFGTFVILSVLLIFYIKIKQ